MPDFHEIIEAQFGTIDASDADQRQAVYAQVRAALKQTVPEDSGHVDAYLSDLERTIAEIELGYADGSVQPFPPVAETAAPRTRRLGTIAALAAAAVGVVAVGLWYVGGSLLSPRPGDGARRVETDQSAQKEAVSPEQAWNAAFQDGDVALLNQAIDAKFKLDTSQFADAYIIQMMQPSKGLANSEFKTALRRLKDDIRPSICVGITLSNIAAVRDMIQQISVDEYRFYCGASKPDFGALRSELSAQWRSTCKSLLPVEELSQKRVLDRDCMHDGFNSEQPIKWESGTAVPTFSRLARIRDAIIELERLL